MRHVLGISARIILVLSVASAPVSAHQVIAAKFDPAKTVALRGTVTAVDWLNPHVHIFMDVQNGNDYNNIRIDLTLDDPGAYTRTWTTGFWIRYSPGLEWDEAICQENNKASDLMIGNEAGLVRKSRIVP